MLQHLAASVNSASTSCPLGNRPSAPVFNNGYVPVSSPASGASARAVTTSTGTARFSTKSSSLTAWTSAGAPVARTASRRKAAFLALLSTRCTRAPGMSASAQAITTPGNPPRSRDRPRFAPPAPAPGAEANRRCGGSTASARWTTRSGSSAAATRAAGRRSGRAAPMFHVKQASAPSARLRSAASSGDSATGRFPALPAQMRDQERQRRRRHAIDAAGLADGARPVRSQLLADLVGQARQRRIVEIVGQTRRFRRGDRPRRRRPGGRDRPSYLASISSCSAIFGGRSAELRPDPRDIADADVRIGQTARTPMRR